MARKEPAEGLRMTTAEQVLGWIFLAFYLVALRFLLPRCLELLKLSSGAYCHYAFRFSIGALLTLICFHRFLLDSFRAMFRRFWPVLQALILGLVFYYVLAFLLSWAANAVFPNRSDPFLQDISALFSEHRIAVILLYVLFAAITEEVLLRGLLFHAIRNTSRFWAYAASAAGSAILYFLQYAGGLQTAGLLLASLLTVPASCVYAWTCDKSGNVWASAILHILVHAVSLGLMPFVIGG